MKSELFLYGYCLVCLGILMFNIVYSVVMKQKDRGMERRVLLFSKLILEQLEKIRGGEQIQAEHLRFLERKLARVNQLITFERAFSAYAEADDPAMMVYHQQLSPIILHLARIYQNRENMQAAYFAYFVSRYRPKREPETEEIERILVSYMRKDSLYCRVNALQALYGFASEESMVEAITLLDRQHGLPHEKILTDGLLQFAGDHAKLVRLLWQKMESFSGKTQLSILNYIRFQSGDYCEQMLAIMQNKSEDKELRLSAIRYFGRYFYAPAKQALLAFASDRNPLNWEYAAIAVSSLGRYDGEDVLEALIGAAHSSNWYVRQNAAASLQAHYLEYSEMMDVLSGRDRYAREMLMYQMDLQRLKSGAQEATI